VRRVPKIGDSARKTPPRSDREREWFQSLGGVVLKLSEESVAGGGRSQAGREKLQKSHPGWP